MSVSGRKANKCTDADRWYKTGLYGSVVTALCCLTPVLVFILGLAGAAFLTTYLDYFLVPLFALFLLVAVYELETRRAVPQARMISRQRTRLLDAQPCA